MDVQEQENADKAKLGCNVKDAEDDDLGGDAEDVEAGAEEEEDANEHPRASPSVTSPLDLHKGVEGENVEQTLSLAAAEARGTHTLDKEGGERHEHEQQPDDNVAYKLGPGVELCAVRKVVGLGGDERAESRGDDRDEAGERRNAGQERKLRNEQRRGESVCEVTQPERLAQVPRRLLVRGAVVNAVVKVGVTVVAVAVAGVAMTAVRTTVAASTLHPRRGDADASREQKVRRRRDSQRERREAVVSGIRYPKPQHHSRMEDSGAGWDACSKIGYASDARGEDTEEDPEGNEGGLVRAIVQDLQVVVLRSAWLRDTYGAVVTRWVRVPGVRVAGVRLAWVPGVLGWVERDGGRDGGDDLLHVAVQVEG